jgi:hypothetical protein
MMKHDAVVEGGRVLDILTQSDIVIALAGRGT